MYHCLYERKNHETQNDQEDFEEELQTRNPRKHQKLQTYTNARRRASIIEAELTFQEIAEILQVSTQAVEETYHRAINKIRILLK